MDGIFRRESWGGHHAGSRVGATSRCVRTWGNRCRSWSCSHPLHIVRTGGVYLLGIVIQSFEVLAVARLVAHGPSHDGRVVAVACNHTAHPLHERHLPVGIVARVSSLWNIMHGSRCWLRLPYKVRILCKARTTHSCSGSGSCVHRSG